MLLLVGLYFAVAGMAPPGINEAHYFAKSKNYWDPAWCARDLFASSGNPHWLFHVTFGSLTQWFSLETTAWIGRFVGWTLLAAGLRSVTRALTAQRFASLIVAMIWIAGVQYFNLAGEWVIGGIEGKVPAYALVLFALRMMIVGRWQWAWLLLGSASAFHVLVGGWSVVAAMIAFACTGDCLRRMPSQLLPLFAGCIIAMVGIYPSILLTHGVDDAVASQAARIYSYQRLTHHLLPVAFESSWYVRHGVVCAAAGLAFWLLRGDREFAPIKWFAIGSMLIAAMGFLVGALPVVAPEIAAGLLRFYWFRMTDAVVPLALGLAWARVPRDVQIDSGSSWRWLLGVSALALNIALAIDTVSMSTKTDSSEVVSVIGMAANDNNRGQVASDWIAACRWIDHTLPQYEVLLSPRNQQTFKWYANRAEVANWKDVPQDAGKLVQWSERFFDVFPRRLGTVRVTIHYDDLLRFRHEYGARFMVVDRRYSGQSLPLVQVYPQATDPPNATYAVYRLP